MAGRLFGTLAADSPYGLLGPPALHRLGQLVGYDIPAHIAVWAERGLDLNDEEDVASLMDFLDSAGGFHFSNERLRRALQRIMDGAEIARAAQVPGAEAAMAPSGDTRGPAARAAPVQPAGCGPRPAATAGTPRCAASRARGAGEVAGPSGRRWDYSRFDGICDSSEGGSEPEQ